MEKGLTVEVERPKLEDGSKLQDEKNEIANAAKKKYAQLYQQMVDKLSVAHLEPFAKILLKHEKFAVRKEDELLDSFKQKVLKDMQRVDEHFWTAFNVATNLQALEMLKEKFKEHDGKDWHIAEQTAESRAMPLRIYFKKAQLRALQKQLKQQEAELQQVLAENKRQRELVQDAFSQQEILREQMERCMESIDLAKPKLEHCKMELLSLMADDDSGEVDDAVDEASDDRAALNTLPSTV